MILELIVLFTLFNIKFAIDQNTIVCLSREKLIHELVIKEYTFLVFMPVAFLNHCRKADKGRKYIPFGNILVNPSDIMLAK